MRILAAVLMIGLSSAAWANNQLCINSMLKLNICDEARRIAAEEQKNLPFNMTERVQVVSFTADANVLSQGIKLLYDRTFFEKALIQQGRSLDSMKKLMFENSKQITCSNDVSKSFLDLGGHMRFLKEFSDGELLYEFYVSSC